MTTTIVLAMFSGFSQTWCARFALLNLWAARNWYPSLHRSMECCGKRGYSAAMLVEESQLFADQHLP
jgi:hypothetical protein